jgi:hypothetical protein
MWAVLYEDGMSLTTASELIARSLAEAERQRGHHVTLRRLDEPVPAPEPAVAPDRTEVPGPKQAVEPAQVTEPASKASSPELTREPGPARAPAPARRRRLLLYALAAASIVVAAALADHWGALPRVGASTSSSPAQASAPHRPQLLPPLDQPPVMHFSNAVNARSTSAGPSAQGPGGGPSTMAGGG